MSIASKPNPTPLGLSPFLKTEPAWSAYERCLLLQQSATWNMFVDDLAEDFSLPILEDFDPPMVARVLGHALSLVPGEGCDALTREILDCQGPNEPELLAGLAHLYVYGLIRVFFNPKGPTPYISAAQSPRISLEQAVQGPSHLLSVSLATTKDLRERILFCDRKRCVFTGVFDNSADMEDLLNDNDESLVEGLSVAHIISQSLCQDIGGLSPAAVQKFQWASTAAAVLDRFGGFSAQVVLGGHNLNSALNAFLARFDAHQRFDTLAIWPRPAKDEQGTVIPHTYDVCHALPPYIFQRTRIRPRVQFHPATKEGILIPPPHPRLLALHAACAQVAHLSGVVERLYDLYPDTDDFSVMTQPSAAFVLERALKSLQIMR